MIPTTRQGLIDYALRALGQDVIEINVSDIQCEDRLDDALQFFHDYHFDGTESMALSYRILGSTIRLTTAVAGTFSLGEDVIGQTSGVKFTLYDKVCPQSAADLLITKSIGGTLTPGEILIGQKSNATAIVNSVTVNSVVVADVTIGDTETHSVPVSDSVIGITNILPLNQSSAGTDFNMFDVRYQWMLNDAFSLTSISMVYYYQVQSHLDMIRMLLVPDMTFEFNRVQGKVFINSDWNMINPGDWIVAEAKRILDPNDFPKIYNDRMLKRYLIAALKWQWGNNLRKFKNLELPGGVLFDASDLMAEGTAEMAAVQQQIMSDFQEPVDFLVG